MPAREKIGEIWGEIRMHAEEWDEALENSIDKLKGFVDKTSDAIKIVGKMGQALYKLSKPLIESNEKLKGWNDKIEKILSKKDDWLGFIGNSHKGFTSLTKVVPKLSGHTKQLTGGMVALAAGLWAVNKMLDAYHELTSEIVKEKTSEQYAKSAVRMKVYLTEQRKELEALGPRTEENAKQYDHLSGNVERATQRIHEIHGSFKRINWETMDFNEKVIDLTASIGGLSEAEKERLEILKNIELIQPSITQSYREYKTVLDETERKWIELQAKLTMEKGYFPILKEGTEQLKVQSSLYDALRGKIKGLDQATRSLGQAWGQMVTGSDKWLQNLFRAGAMLAAKNLLPPGVDQFGLGFLGELLKFAEGGVSAVPKAQQGIVTKVNKPTLTKHGVLTGEHYETEWVLNGQQLTELFKAMQTKVEIYNATEDLLVRRVGGLSEGNKRILARILGEEVLPLIEGLDA